MSHIDRVRTARQILDAARVAPATAPAMAREEADVIGRCMPLYSVRRGAAKSWTDADIADDIRSGYRRREAERLALSL